MRKVKYYEYVDKVVDGKRICEKVLKGIATFHQFGIGFEEFETGAANYTTAVIELDNGAVKNICCENIEFCDKQWLEK